MKPTGLWILCGALGACNPSGGEGLEETPTGALPMVNPRVATELAPGMVFERAGAGAVVPEAGEWVIGIGEREDGTAAVVRIETLADGTVLVDEETDAAAAPEGLAGAGETPYAYACGLSACNDGAHALFGHYTSSWSYYFKKSSVPSYLDPYTVETEIRNAVTGIVNASDSCGLADNVSATRTYLGTTTSSSNVQSNVWCSGSPDTKSVVDFGPLGGPAYTCAFSNGTRDVRLSTGHSWFVNKPANCSGKYHIRSVMTHEAGHVFGLAHVDKDCHPGLTMRAGVGTCTTNAATLGLGDVRGLERLY